MAVGIAGDSVSWFVWDGDVDGSVDVDDGAVDVDDDGDVDVFVECKSVKKNQCNFNVGGIHLLFYFATYFGVYNSPFTRYLEHLEINQMFLLHVLNTCEHVMKTILLKNE